ncbi:uroporphyrinogen-III synthase/methyltransferase [Cenarchaeum symbiosum A]|uniref:Uroporphyrinogen-III synthase/methyltransferase n=1 Tax=Cenarchaeum symbiosum (strain A) TaxID=414004 RepID=A0RXB0_CENSY|nr:uroporphyrinogen-III synthase/methyltransferase [Cenarchaeum symbiosum A]
MNGRTIAITRSPEDSAQFAELAARDGARAMPLPTIELVPRDDMVDSTLREISENDPDYTVFMSSKAVRLLFDAAESESKLEKLQLAVANTSVVAVGPVTRGALEGRGIRVAHTPERYSSVGVGEVFSALGAEGKKVFVPRSGASTPFLRDLLTKMGLDVHELHLYDVRASGGPQWDEFRELLPRGGIDGIVFTSASSVRAFFELMHGAELPEGIRAVAIGPFTADELAKFGVEHTIAGVHTVPGAFDAIKSALAAGGAT